MTNSIDTETQTALHTSILELADYDFSGEWKTDIYLDPETEKLYTFTNTGGVPRTVFHGIDQHILSVSPKVIPQSVVDALLYVESLLESVLKGWEGTEWNGNNHIGLWSEDSLDLLTEIQQKTNDYEIAHYWDASEWFSPVIDDLKTAWREGKTAEQIIDAENLGNDADGMCDRSEAISWLEYMIGEWESEALADEDED